MIHIAGGIILAVLGLRAIGLFAYSLQTENGPYIWGLIAFGLFGAVSFLIDFHYGEFIFVGIIVIVGYTLLGHAYNNSTVDWKPRKDLGRRIR